MPARPSFDTIPPTAAEGALLHDRSLRRAQAIEVLAAPRPQLGGFAMAALCIVASCLAYSLSSYASWQSFWLWLGAFSAGMCFQLWNMVRDLQARVDALQELLREADGRG